jgi:hypothetical protein
MKEKICYLIHTEYHLLLSIDDISKKYFDTDKFDVQLILKTSSKSNRLKQDLNLSFFPYSIKLVNFNIDLNSKLILSEKKVLDDLLENKYSVFIFFQEQDPISIILIDKFIEDKTKIYLYQDGLKPYCKFGLKSSVGIYLNFLKQKQWIKKNGYSVKNSSSFNSYKYGFLYGIDKLFLTFPESYNNWKNLPVEKFVLNFDKNIQSIFKRVFNWNSSLLSNSEGVIFFMNQPMDDDGLFEVNILQNLRNRFPNSKIYIKNHPLTSSVKINSYKLLQNVEIIDSKIPAELFIYQLNKSIVISVYSTAMFINNPKCKFYYLYNIKQSNNVRKLKKIKIINPTPHVITVKSLSEIVF